MQQTHTEPETLDLEIGSSIRHSHCSLKRIPQKSKEREKLEPHPQSPDPPYPKLSKRKVLLSKAATAANPRKITVAAAAPESGQPVSSNQFPVSDEATPPQASSQLKLTRGSTAPLPSQAQSQKPPRSPLSRHAETPKTVDDADNNKNSDDNSAFRGQPPRRTSFRKLYGEMVETQEAEALCSRLGMTRKDVWRLRKQFNGEDTENTNTITQTAFFFLINEERRNLTRTIFRLGKIPFSQPRLSFDEYLCCICEFASLSEVELLKFFYEVYNEDSTTGGTMGESEILKLGKELQAMDSAFSKNVGIATKKMASSRDLMSQQTLLTFQDFERLSRQNGVAFYPLFQMQRNVRVGSLGEEYWIKKTREKLEVEYMLKYMARNNGRQPDVDWKTKILDIVFHRENLAIRVRRRARLLYEAQYRHLVR